MSVCSCSRFGCRNVMCDTLIEGQYVCPKCIKEFKEFTGGSSRPLSEFQRLLQEFLETLAKDDRLLTFDEFVEGSR